MRLERGGEIADALQIPDVAFLAALGAVGTAAALYLWGIPFLATVAASGVPVSWEKRLGKAVGMIALLEGLHETGTKAPVLPQYLSAHPSTEKRIQRLRLLASQTGSHWTRHLPDYDWRDPQNICPACRRQP